jgi:hypothetical protein
MGVVGPIDNADEAGFSLLGLVYAIGRITDPNFARLAADESYRILFTKAWTPELQERFMDEIIGGNLDVEIATDLTSDNFITISADGTVTETVFGTEVGQLMNLGWSLDIENSMLWAPELGAGEDAVDALFFFLLF